MGKEQSVLEKLSKHLAVFEMLRDISAKLSELESKSIRKNKC